MGSCVDDKCSGINSTSLIPELQKANHYPGRTSCFESCGGLGCDCFYPSSGCLFYRIYATPKNKDIFEISKCIQWKEEVKLEIAINSYANTQYEINELLPNVPVTIGKYTITMSTLALPPLPILNQQFISNGRQVALWKENTTPFLTCNSHKDAICKMTVNVDQQKIG